MWKLQRFCTKNVDELQVEIKHYFDKVFIENDSENLLILFGLMKHIDRVGAFTLRRQWKITHFQYTVRQISPRLMSVGQLTFGVLDQCQFHLSQPLLVKSAGFQFRGLGDLCQKGLSVFLSK